MPCQGKSGHRPLLISNWETGSAAPSRQPARKKTAFISALTLYTHSHVSTDSIRDRLKPVFEGFCFLSTVELANTLVHRPRSLPLSVRAGRRERPGLSSPLRVGQHRPVQSLILSALATPTSRVALPLRRAPSQTRTLAPSGSGKEGREGERRLTAEQSAISSCETISSPSQPSIAPFFPAPLSFPPSFPPPASPAPPPTAAGAGAGSASGAAAGSSWRVRSRRSRRVCVPVLGMRYDELSGPRLPPTQTLTSGHFTSKISPGRSLE